MLGRYESSMLNGSINHRRLSWKGWEGEESRDRALDRQAGPSHVTKWFLAPWASRAGRRDETPDRHALRNGS